MLIFHEAHRLQQYLSRETTPQGKTGFVPTMGALHQGHLSLLKEARRQTDRVVVSIFVNPTQFNDQRDFENYPITLSEDIKRLSEAGCAILFLPSVNEIYPNGSSLEKPYQLGYLETVLEGRYRPGHFQGVCQVVERLLLLVQPELLFLGQKDYQQCMVLNSLVRDQPAFQSIQVVVCPTLRETDGLAMSSRNTRLTTEQRKQAPAIHQALLDMKKAVKPEKLEGLKQQAVQFLTEKGFRVDYAELAEAHTLELKQEWNGRDPLVGLIAAFLGDIRLIDNMILTESGFSSDESV